MAAGETATVFLETSLGTRLAVSFPARATTVADLKRQVSAEHAECFPLHGPVAVASLQIKLDGSWFRLTDSMAVRAAFEWVKGPWLLLVEAHELRPKQLARKDAKCGTGDAEPNAGHPVIADDSSCYMLPPAEASRGDNHASGSGITDSPRMENRQDKAREGGEHCSGQCEDGQESSDPDLASGDRDTSPMNQQDKSHEDAEHPSGRLEDGTTTPQECSDSDLAAGGCHSPPMNQQEKSHEDVARASGQLEDGITMPQELSDSDLTPCSTDKPPMNQQDKSHEYVARTSGQLEGGITMPQESSDLGVAADKENDPVGSQQKDIVVEPRGKKRSREEDKADESIDFNCDDSRSSLASSTLKVVSDKKSSVIEQAKLNNVPLTYNLEDCSHDLGEKPSGGQKEQRTSGAYNDESSNNRSDIPPCVVSMERHNKSSDEEVQTQRGDKEELQIAGCVGKISCKRTDDPHRVESMIEDDMGPPSSGYYLDKGKNEGATSTSKEYEPCFRTRHQRVAVRKVPMSRARKIYAVRC